MNISGQVVLRDYQTLRQAAASKEANATLEMAAQPVDLVSSQIDNNPATTDTIVASSWDGGFSSAVCTETYREYNQDGRNMLEYTKVNPGSPFTVGSQPETVVHNLPL